MFGKAFYVFESISVFLFAVELLDFRKSTLRKGTVSVIDERLDEELL